MPQRVTALTLSQVPPEHPDTPVQRTEDFVDELPLERITGLAQTYYLVTRPLLKK
jgi:hypothetical protein